MFDEHLATIRPEDEPMGPESQLLDYFEMGRDYVISIVTFTYSLLEVVFLTSQFSTIAKGDLQMSPLIAYGFAFAKCALIFGFTYALIHYDEPTLRPTHILMRFFGIHIPVKQRPAV